MLREKGTLNTKGAPPPVALVSNSKGFGVGGGRGSVLAWKQEVGGNSVFLDKDRKYCGGRSRSSQAWDLSLIITIIPQGETSLLLPPPPPPPTSQMRKLNP